MARKVRRLIAAIARLEQVASVYGRGTTDRDGLRCAREAVSQLRGTVPSYAAGRIRCLEHWSDILVDGRPRGRLADLERVRQYLVEDCRSLRMVLELSAIRRAR